MAEILPAHLEDFFDSPLPWSELTVDQLNYLVKHCRVGLRQQHADPLTLAGCQRGLDRLMDELTARAIAEDAERAFAGAGSTILSAWLIFARLTDTPRGQIVAQVLTERLHEVALRENAERDTAPVSTLSGEEPEQDADSEFGDALGVLGQAGVDTGAKYEAALAARTR